MARPQCDTPLVLSNNLSRRPLMASMGELKQVSIYIYILTQAEERGFHGHFMHISKFHANGLGD